MKQSINKCLSEYSTKELVEFHANLNAIFICCTEDFNLFPLLMQVHFALTERNDPLANKYLNAITSFLKAS